MIFKVVSCVKDKKGNYPVVDTVIEECEKVAHSNKSGVHHFSLEKKAGGIDKIYEFDLTRKDIIYNIYLESDTGKTVETYRTAWK